jgi:hypothetical protein
MNIMTGKFRVLFIIYYYYFLINTGVRVNWDRAIFVLNDNSIFKV